MNPQLLHSQFETLEAPEHALAIDITPPPETVGERNSQKAWNLSVPDIGRPHVADGQVTFRPSSAPLAFGTAHR